MLTSTRGAPALLGLLGLSMAACAPLEPIPENTCGNQVLERDRREDCDTFAAAGDVAPKGVVLVCGAPTDPRACLYTCDTEVTAGCPVGWACGADAVCRKPALTFSPGAPTTMSVAPQEVAFADFDGNALHDLAFFAGDALVIRYASGGGGFGPEYVDALGSASVGRSFGFGAAIGAVDGDGITDLVAPTPGGALVLRGSATQILQPVPYPAVVLPIPRSSFQLPTLATVRAPGSLFETVVFLAYRNRETLIFPSGNGQLRPLDGARLPAPALDAGMSNGRVTRVLAIADLNGDGGSELAVGYPGHTLITFATVQAGTSTSGEPAVFGLAARSVELPLPLVDTLALSDYDGDGDPDLIAEVAPVDGRPRVVVARYAAGQFSPPEPVITAPLAVMYSGGVLAIGDVNFDQRADFVVAGLPDRDGLMVGAVVVSTSSVAGRYVGVPIASEILTEAVIGDLNRDRAPDIAATGQVSPGIGVYLGSGLGVFNPSRLDTTAFAHTLRVGDFDGDYVGDLAFLEESQGVVDIASVTVGGSDTVRLQVAFGRGQGAPSAPISMGVVPRPVSLGPAYFIDPDLVSDVVMLTSDDDGLRPDPRYSLYAFRGASDRRVRATLGIAGPGRPITGLWLGNFDDTEGTDLVAFAQPPSGPIEPGFTLRPLWGLTGTDLRASASEAGHAINAGTCDAVLRDSTNLKRGFVAKLALDAEGDAGAKRDLLVRFGISSDASLAAGTLELSALDVQLERTSATCAQDTTPALGLGEVTAARMLDVDGDQEDDLLLIQDGADPTLGTNGITLRWSARLHTGRRGLAYDAATVVSGPVADAVLDVALTDLDADGLADLVAATYGGVYVARQEAPRVFAAFVPVDGGAVPGGPGTPVALGERAIDQMQQFVSMVRIFAEDFDGDRLADVLVIRDRTIQPYRGLAVPPGGGRLIDETQQPVEEEAP